MPKYDTYRVTLHLEDRLVGGVPVVADIEDRAKAYEQWAVGQGVDKKDAKDLGEKLAKDPDTPKQTVEEEEPEGLATSFRADSAGIYIEARQVKAMIKESAQRLGLVKQVRGVRQVLQHDLHVRALDGTQKLRPAGEPQKPDGTDRRPISVLTPQGPRTAIKTFDYLREPDLTFRVIVLAGGVGNGLVGETQLREVLANAGLMGLGADRSQGEGCFTLVELQREADA